MSSHARPPSLDILSISMPFRLVPLADRREELMRAIVHEYRQVPELSLTVATACELFELQADTCLDLLTCMVEDRVLEGRPDGSFVARSLASKSEDE